MELVIFMGMQASGKSTYYARRFADTHIRINLDMLKTRRREAVLFEACLSVKQPMVIDNTNPTPADRARYIPLAKAKGFSIVGYYFQSHLDDCKQRNESRSSQQAVPFIALLGTYNRLTQPTLAEGFDRLYYVKIDENSQLVVEEWTHEV